MLTLSHTVFLALLMVSTVRYRSFKKLDIKRKESFFALVLLSIGLFIVASAPTEMIFFVSLAYVSWGLAEELFYLYQKKRLTLNLDEPDEEAHEAAPDSLRVIQGKKDS